MKEIHIHEDDWGMRGLHPVSAWTHVAADLDRAIEAGLANAALDGSGWTDVYIIEPPAHDYTRSGVTIADVGAELSKLFPRVTTFVATATAGFDRSTRDPFGSYETDAWCFGSDADCFIKLEPAGDLVKSIWFEARTTDRGQLDKLQSAVKSIDAIVPSVLVDHWLQCAGRIGDQHFLRDYFATLRTQ